MGDLVHSEEWLRGAWTHDPVGTERYIQVFFVLRDHWANHGVVRLVNAAHVDVVVNIERL